MTQYELVFMQWLLSATKGLQPVARILTEFGGGAFIFVLVAVFYFAIDKDKGERLAVTALASSCFNEVLKLAIRRPRPFMYNKDLAYKGMAEHYANTYSCPSGHAQNGAATYSAVMMLVKNRWVRGLCIAAMVIVPLTRVFLGVHFLTDVLLGTAIGICFGVGFLFFLNKIWDKRDWWYLGFGITCVVLTFVVFLPISLHTTVHFTGKAFGTFGGMMFGLLLEHRFGRMQNATVWWHRIVRLLLLGAYAAVVFFSLDALFGLVGDHFTLDFTKYFLTIGSAMGVIPLCIRKLKI